MASIIRFFEKPNCIGNARQKAILTTAGHKIIVENLLTYPFTKSELRSYFGSLPIIQWFNPSSPKIKSREIDITTMNEEQALNAMIDNPVLIRRPLLEVTEKRFTGFDIEELEKNGINCSSSPRLNLLKGHDLEECPGYAVGIKCDEPRTLPNPNL